MREIIEVPLPLADSSLFINFLTFHISIFFSASFCCGALIFAGGAAGGRRLDLTEKNQQLRRCPTKDSCNDERKTLLCRGV